MRIAHVYKITSPSGKIYVGSTVNVKNRFKDYQKLRCKQQYKLYASFLKYGVERHVFEIICECTTDNMFLLEAQHGKLYDVIKRGLNLRLPKGDETYITIADEVKKRIGYHASNRSAETIAKIKESKKNPSEQTRENYRQSALNRPPVSDETREKHRQSGLLKVITESHIEALRNSNIGKIRSEETRHRQSLSSAVKKLILNLETGIYYDSFRDASDSIGINRHVLRQRIRRGTEKTFTCA